MGGGGAPIAAEVWELPVDGFGAFVGDVPAPLAIGTVALEDGSTHAGFLCEAWATAGAPDITDTGDWLRYLAAGAANSSDGSHLSATDHTTATRGARP
jgi:allophanate hydrolase